MNLRHDPCSIMIRLRSNMEATMSQVQLKTRRSGLGKQGQALSRQQAENVLREAAFVLEMTRQVKDAILNNKSASPRRSV